jgi:hypothetical protein
MSGHNLPDWFIPKYNEEVALRGQQLVRRFEGCTVDTGNFVGDDCYFPRFGSVDTYKSERMAQLTLANAKMDWVKTNAVPEFVAFGIWDPDKKKLGPNAPGQFAQAAVRAMNRAHDRQIIDTLNDAMANGVTNTRNDLTETPTTIGDYNTTATLEVLMDAYQRIGTNEMLDDGMVVVAAPQKLLTQWSLDPYLVKSDVKGNRPWDNWKFVQYERLAGNGTTGTGRLDDAATGVDCLMWVSDAVASSQNDGDTPINERLAGQLTDMMGMWFQACSKVLLPEGTIRVKSAINFALARAPIPTHAV